MQPTYGKISQNMKQMCVLTVFQMKMWKNSIKNLKNKVFNWTLQKKRTWIQCLASLNMKNTGDSLCTSIGIIQ